MTSFGDDDKRGVVLTVDKGWSYCALIVLVRECCWKKQQYITGSSSSFRSWRYNKNGDKTTKVEAIGNDASKKRRDRPS
jgi:hypothetical protein